MANPIFDKPKVQLDSTVYLEARRVTIRTNEVIWNDLDHDRWFGRDNEFKVLLQKSDSPKSGFRTIHEFGYDAPHVYIDDNSLTTMYRTEIMYYRLVRDDRKVTSKVYSSEKLHNLYGAEIVNRHYIQLKEGHSGNPMYLFIKRRTGERCPDCWDTIRGVRTKSNCKTCYGTGYIKGYCDPICIYVSVSPEQAAIEQPETGTEVAGRLQGWTLAFPRINLGDVLVDPATQDIWCVSQVGVTTHKRTPTKQELIMERHNEDTSIMELLSIIPRIPKKEDRRHGEICF